MLKRLLYTLIVTALVLGMLAGCSRNKDPDSFDPEACKSMADVFVYESKGSAFNERYFAYAFEVNGTVYRAEADMEPFIEERLSELSITDDNYDKDMRQIAGPLEIKRIVNVSEKTPTQDELNALVGKTGSELLDDGFTVNGWNLKNMVFWMTKEEFTYELVFDGELELEDTDDFIDDDIADLRVKSVRLDGIGDASWVDESQYYDEEE